MRLLVAGLLSAAAFGVASPAYAVSPTVIPQSEQDPDNPGHCAKVEVVYARGTSEPTQNSWALNGFNYTPQNYWGTSRNSPYAIWYQITRDLGNRSVTYTNGAGATVTEPEYTMLYPNSLSVPQESRNRSDFYLYNLPYPADLSFLNGQSSNNSVQQGTKTLITHLNTEGLRCPGKKFLMFGYSQGALIVANAISFPSQQKYVYDNDNNPATPHPVPPLDYDVMDQIVSVGMLADGGFNSTEKLTIWNPATQSSRFEYNRTRYSGALIPEETPWNLDANTPSQSNGRRNMAGTSSGAAPLTGTVRGQLEAPPLGPAVGLRSNYWHWSDFEDRIRDYCVLTDPICNRSATDAGEHFNYFNNAYPRRDLQVFAVRKLRESDPRWAGQFKGTGFPTFWNPDSSLIAP